VSSPDETEVAHSFFPLREGEDSSALDSCNWCALNAGFGARRSWLPVDPETANEPVKADVVLGRMDWRAPFVSFADAATDHYTDKSVRER